MPFDVPTLKGLAERTARSFRANLMGSDAFLWPNNLAVSAKVIAGAVWEAFSFLDYIQRHILVHTSTDPWWVERHAAEYGMARLPATYAVGSALISGDSDVAVPAGIVLQRADGLQYEVTQGGQTNNGGEAEVAVRALTAGKAGNAAPGVGLAMTVPMSRLNTAAEVATAGIGAGADTEGTESLRERVLFRKRMPPHGGAAHDYVAWAREINGVTRVFVDPVTSTNGRNSVGIWFLMDATYPNGIPQASDVAGVSAYIDTVRPAGAILAIAAPVAAAIDIGIDNLSPDTVAVRNAIHAELADLFRRSAVSTLTSPLTLYRSQITEAIAIATGEQHHVLTSPATDVALPAGHVPVLGTVSFT